MYLVASRYLNEPWYLIAICSINVATIALYGLDKLLALMDARRIPERLLFFVAFIFGSPGAILAMIVFRHKTSKVTFQFILAILILIQALVIAGIFYCFPQVFVAKYQWFGVN
jgi:uncharacterized membrane protein YsdA (DUF1294 family)